jgi:hypothetical protein
MEDIFTQQQQDFLATLDSDAKVLTAMKFISENPDCSMETAAQSVEIQHGE